MKPLKLLVFICAYLIFTPVLLAAGQPAAAMPATGTVAETMISGGYVYIRLEEQGTWLAASAFDVSVGDVVQYSGGMEMKEFHSKSLDRTFESIYFVSSASLAGKGDAAKPAAVMPAAQGNKAASVQKSVSFKAPAMGEIKPLQDGKTIAAIFSESADLKEQVVSLNAKVIKVSKNVMGKNWITLQDGTGTEPDNKLLATSQEEVSPGSIVVVKGTVKTDIDLGYGYSYKVLLEESTFSPGIE
jgi:hypothetical protein